MTAAAASGTGVSRSDSSSSKRLYTAEPNTWQELLHNEQLPHSGPTSTSGQGEAERQWQQHVSDVNAMLHLTFQQQSPLASAAFFESLAQDLEPFPGPALGCMPVSLLEPGSGDEIDSEASRELSMAFMEALSSQGLVSHPALPPPALHAGNSATTSGAGSTIMSSQCWADERELRPEKLDHNGLPLMPVGMAALPDASLGSSPDVDALVGSFGESTILDDGGHFTDSPMPRRPRRPVRIVRRPQKSPLSASLASPHSAPHPGMQPHAGASRSSSSPTSRRAPHAPASAPQLHKPSPTGSGGHSPRRSHKKRAAPALVADQEVHLGRPQEPSPGSMPAVTVIDEAASSCSNEELPGSPSGSESAAAVPHAIAPAAFMQHAPWPATAAVPIMAMQPSASWGYAQRPVASAQIAAAPPSSGTRAVVDGQDDWGRSPLHVAAAGGQADAVQHLLHAGCDGRKWLPLDYRGFQYSAALQRAAAKVYSNRAARTPASAPPPAPSASTDTTDPGSGSLPPLQHAPPPLISQGDAQPSASQPAPSAAMPGSQQHTAWPMPSMPQEGVLCGTFGLSLPAVEVDEAFWHWGEDQRERGLHAWLAPLSFKHCTPLHLAAFYGHTSVVNVLLASNACEPNARNAQGCTALHMAAHQGHAETATRLCKADGCDMDAGDGMGRTALHHAAALGHDAVVQELWGKGCSVQAVDIDGWTALHHASQAGHTEAAAKLVIAGAPVQACDAQSRTPAHLAARRGAHEVVDKLLMAGYDVDALGGECMPGHVAHAHHADDLPGAAVLHIAARHGHLLLVDKLLRAGADFKLQDCRGYTPIFCAAEGGHADVFRLLLQASDNLSGVDDSGASVLHAAAVGGCCEIVDILLEKGCDLSSSAKDGCSIMHYAALGKTRQVVEHLMAKGAALDVVDDLGNTPWHAAAEAGNLDAMALFMRSKCDPNVRTKAGWSPLHFAARSGNFPIIDLLLLEGAEAGAATYMGDTALQLAARSGHERVAARLLQPQRNSAAEAPPPAHLHAADRLGWTALHCACQHGSLPVVHLLLQAGAQLEVQTLDGLTPLHLAAMGRWTPVVNCLMDAGADATKLDCERCMPLHRAVRLADTELFNALFPASASCLQLEDVKGWTVLHYAVEGGSPDIVAALLASGSFQLAPATTTPAVRGFTPLHLAAQKGHATLVPRLLQAGFNATDLAGDGRSPLHYAALGSGAGGAGPAGMAAASQALALASVSRAGAGAAGKWEAQGHAQSCRLLLAAGASAPALDANGCSALHYAAGTGELDICEQLFAEGLAVNMTDKSGWTPLLWAASGGHTTVVRRLLEVGAEVHVTDRIGRSVLHLAAEHGHSDAVSELVTCMHGQQLDLHVEDGAGRTAVQVAAGQGHLEVVAIMLDNSRSQTGKGLTALHLAVTQGREPLVADLLKLPSVAVDAKDSDGLTALHWAASKGSEGNVELLLAAGCGVDLTTNDGWTALHEASANGHNGVVELLLQANSQVNIKTANGSTALHNAATNGHEEIVRLLLNVESCSINARALSGATALYGAASGGNLTAVRRLLAANAEVDAMTTAGSTACAVAASSGHTPVVRALITGGCDVDLQAQNGCTALHNAAGGGHAAVVSDLLAAGCDTDIQNSHGNTALHVAASKGHLEVVEVLLAGGADVHIKNSKAWAAVHSAAAAGHFEPVLRLIQHGSAWRARADVDVIKMLMRKTSLKHSYVEGRLRLAEKERARRQSRAAAPSVPAIASVPEGSGSDAYDLAQLEAQANANMAALLLEEASSKEAVEKRRERRKEKKKKKGKKAGSDDAAAEQSADEEGSAQSAHETRATSPCVRGEHAEQPAQPSKPPDPTSDPPAPAHPAPSRATGSVADVRHSSGDSLLGVKDFRSAAEAAPPSTPRQPLPRTEKLKKHKQPSTASANGPSEDVRTPRLPVPSRPDGSQQAPASGKTAVSASQPHTSPSKAPAVDLLTRRGAASSTQPHTAAGTPQHEPQPAVKAAKAGRDRDSGQPITSSWSRVVRQLESVAEQEPAGQPLRPSNPARAAAAAAATASSPDQHVAKTGQQRQRKPRSGLATQPQASSAALSNVPAPAQRTSQRLAPQQGGEALQNGPVLTPGRGRQRGHARGSSAKGPDPTTAAAVRAAIAPSPKSPRAGGSTPRRASLVDTTAAVSQAVASAVLATPPAPRQPVLDPKQSPRSPIRAVAPPSPSSPQQPQSIMQPLAEPFIPATLMQPTVKAPHAHANGKPALRPPFSPPGHDPLAHKAALQPPKQQQLEAESSWGAPAVPGSHIGVDWSFGGAAVSSQMHRAGSAGTLARVSSPTLSALTAPPPSAEQRKVSSLDNSAEVARSAASTPSRPLARTLAFQPGQQQQGTANGLSAPQSSAAGSSLRPMQLGNGIPSSGGNGSIWGGLPSASGAAHVHTSNGVATSSGLPAASSSPVHQAPGEVNHKMARLYGLTCPLTKQLMHDPVVAGDGYTYERSAIEAWLKRNDTSPITHQPLKLDSELMPNLTMRSAIHLLIPQH